MSYSTGEFSVVVNVSTRKLRYYEDARLIQVKRDPNGNRRYTDDDVDWIFLLEHLTETGMPMKNVKKYATLRHKGDSTLPERLLMLRDHRIFMLKEKARLETSLEQADARIKAYEASIAEIGR